MGSGLEISFLIFPLNFFPISYILILIRQKNKKILLFERKVFSFWFLDRKEMDGFPLPDQVEDKFRGNDI